MQSAIELSDTVKPSSGFVSVLSRDLELLIDVGLALRSVPEDEIERWLIGENSLIKPDNPHKVEVKYHGQPVIGIMKEYDVAALSGERYRLAVHPKKLRGIQSNDVRVKFGRTYSVGENSVHGTLDKHEDKSVLYLLPLVARLPLKDISYEKVREFFEKNNGFVDDIRRSDMTSFRDSYMQKRLSDPFEPLVFSNEKGERVKPKLRTIVEPVWFDVYVNVYNVSHKKEVKVELEVVMPNKAA